MSFCKQMKEHWEGNWCKHQTLFAELRSAKKDEHTFVGKTILRLLLIVPTISPANLFLDPKPYDQRETLTSRGMDYYIFLWAMGLSVLLLGFTSPTQWFTVNLSHTCQKILVAFLPVCR